MKNLPTMESIAGTYELKEKGGFSWLFGDTYRWVFLANGTKED